MSQPLQPPPSLPRAIASFITRSKELAKADPIVSYLCKLYAVEQILTQGAHTSDDQIAAFAMTLLDEVESAKTSSSVDFLDVIGDKETSIAYVLNFSNGIFGNALMQIQDQKTSKQTAMSLLACVNFFELLQLWKEDSERIEEVEEVSKKVKYAKYHAARILKTLKNGGDPNEYVPPKNEFNDDEKEEGVDESKEESIIPIVEPEGSNSDNFGLPSVPTTISQSTSPQNLPKVVNDDPKDIPTFIDDAPGSISLPDAPTSLPDNEAPFTLPDPPTIAPEVTTPSPPKKEVKKEINVAEILESSEVYSKAQKHAKFAISAMNYEDKNTAMKELQQALEMLAKLRN